MNPEQIDPSTTGSELLINLVTRVILQPEKFKLCEQCNTILSKSVAVCRCGSYNHNPHPEAVKNSMKEVAKGNPLMDLINWLEKKKL